MKLREMLYKIKPPCGKCPYKMGMIHFLQNPCPACKSNGYQTYERIKLMHVYVEEPSFHFEGNILPLE